MYRDAAKSVEHLYCSCCGMQLGTRCERCGCKVSAKDSFCCQCSVPVFGNKQNSVSVMKRKWLVQELAAPPPDLLN